MRLLPEGAGRRTGHRDARTNSGKGCGSRGRKGLKEIAERFGKPRESEDSPKRAGVGNWQKTEKQETENRRR
jgi:hypothetical protein